MGVYLCDADIQMPQHPGAHCMAEPVATSRFADVGFLDVLGHAAAKVGGHG